MMSRYFLHISQTSPAEKIFIKFYFLYAAVLKAHFIGIVKEEKIVIFIK